MLDKESGQPLLVQRRYSHRVHEVELNNVGEMADAVERAEDHWAIVPDKAPWYNTWEIYSLAVLLANAFWEPFSIAVLRRDPPWATLLNLYFDLMFTIDMVLHFFVAIPCHVEGTASRVLWERDLRKIASFYCGWPFSRRGEAGWFWVDFLAVFPGWVQLVLLAAMGGSDEVSDFHRTLILLHSCRLLRTMKLVRISKALSLWHANHGFPFFVVDLLKFFLITTITCHWVACMWLIIEGRVLEGKITYKTQKESWLSALIGADGKGDCCDPPAAENPLCVYWMALYWAMMTLTSIGYGDITPQNQLEYKVCAAVLLIAAYTWAYIVGKMVAVLASLNPHETEFRQQADSLQNLMDARQLPNDLQIELRRYLHQAKDTSLQDYHRRLLETNISESLQREVASHRNVCRQFREAVFWARDLQQDALLDLVRSLMPHCFGPGEAILLTQTLILMQRGVAVIGSRVLNRGDVYGENDILLETLSLISSMSPHTLTHVDILALTRSSLISVAMHFPSADSRLRRAQIRVAAWRAFVLSAKKERSAQTLNSIGARRLSKRANGTAENHRLSITFTRRDESGDSAVTSFARPGFRRPSQRELEQGDDRGEPLSAVSGQNVKAELLDMLRRYESLDASVDKILAALDSDLPRTPLYSSCATPNRRVSKDPQLTEPHQTLQADLDGNGELHTFRPTVDTKFRRPSTSPTRTKSPTTPSRSERMFRHDRKKDDNKIPKSQLR